MAIAVAGCTSPLAAGPTPSATASASVSPSRAASVTPSATSSTAASPTPTASDADPAFIPALAAIQMVGARVGWAVGSHAIFATTDGTHWTKQHASTEEFVGVDFVSPTTGWAVGVRSLLGTTDGGRTWRQLGQAPRPIRSVHFVNASTGWGISGGTDPGTTHGWLVPRDGAALVVTHDGGMTWTTLDGPDNPQTACFSDPAQGWIGTKDGVYLYKNIDQGQTWSKVLQRPETPIPELGTTLVQCAAPRGLWVLFVGGGAAAGRSPYIAYATVDGSSWRAVLKEPMTMSQPGVPPGPDSYPPSFSVVAPTDAVFIGDGPATGVAQCVIASNGGAILRRTGRIENAAETFAAAFVSVTAGWVLTRKAGGDYVIDATTDGGYQWTQQLAVLPSSAG
jgi:hypothetical protein